MARTTPRNWFVAFSLALAAGATWSCGDPAEAGSGEAHDIVQMGCSADADCEGGRCVDGLPGGLCTRNCVAHEDCPDGTRCTDTEAPDGICLFTCTSADQCRDDVGPGYVCDTESDLVTGEDIRVCIDE